MKATRSGPVKQDRGGALLGVMLLTMMLAAISVTLTLSGQTELLIARSDESAAQAQAAAEAGLAHAIDITLAHLEQWQENGFSSQSEAVTALLEGPDGATGTTQADADNGSLEGLGIPRVPASVPLPGGFGVSYQARLYDEDDPGRGTTLSDADVNRIGENGLATSDTNTGIVVLATGHVPAASVRLEATIGTRTLPAILINGSFEMAGGSEIINGGVHTNGDLLLSGSPDIEGNATASGSYSASGNPDVDGSSGGGYTNITVPPIQASDFREDATTVLTVSGTVTDTSETVLCDASGDNDACEAAHGWTFNGGAGWEYTNRNHPGGTFFVETDAEISDSQGSPNAPIPLTVIAEGSIDITGSPNTVSDTSGLAFVTDMDLRFGGGANYSVGGRILIHEQLGIQGSPDIVGQITVEDAPTVSDLVTDNRIAGSPSITLDDGINGGIGVTAWRDVR